MKNPNFQFTHCHELKEHQRVRVSPLFQFPGRFRVVYLELRGGEWCTMAIYPSCEAAQMLRLLKKVWDGKVPK